MKRNQRVNNLKKIAQTSPRRGHLFLVREDPARTERRTHTSPVSVKLQRQKKIPKDQEPEAHQMHPQQHRRGEAALPEL